MWVNKKARTRINFTRTWFICDPVWTRTKVLLFRRLNLYWL